MTAPSVLSAANRRLEYLLLSDGPPARCHGDLRPGVMQLHSELVDLEQQLMDVKPSHLWKQAIRLAYDIEDTIDSNALVKSCGCLSKLFSERSLLVDLKIFLGKIQVLKSLVNFDKIVNATEGISSRSGMTFDATRSSSVSAESFVGMEYEKELLFHHLFFSDYSVIAILGLGGSGKTALAQSVYNHYSVREHFDLRVWVSVGMNLRPREILEVMLLRVGVNSVSQSISEMETTELMEQLYKVQKGRRCLVVLDDVWSLDAWNTIRPVLPQDDNASRVIITTRLQDSVPPSLYIHRKSYMTQEESWMLMEIVSQIRDILDMEFRKIGLQILEQCRGNPLSIIVASNLLKGKKLDEWKVVLQYLEQHQNRDGGVGNILGLSYDTLPIHLKPCFVYLGHYPSNHDILVDRLYLLWMAEGLVSTKDVPNLSNFDIAEANFKELVDRRMVTVQNEEEWDAQRPKSCRIHDLLRDLCIKKGKEEEFLKVVGSVRVKETSFTSPRLAIYLNTHDNIDRVSLETPEAKTIRSLLLFKTQKNSKWPSEIADLKEFRYMRVLDFNEVNFRVQKLPKNIDKLVYLRYLSFRGCYIMEFPSSFRNFPFLETLDLRVIETCRMTLPNVLRKLTSLRHLYFPVMFQIGRDTQDDHKLRLDALTRLEILENFDANLCDVADLHQLQKIQVFSGVVDGNNEDLEKIINFLNENVRSSRQTSLLVKNFDCYSEKRFSILENLLDCHALHALEIEGFLGELRILEGISLTSNFTKMVFNESEFGQDPMQILGMLPNLRSLVLCNDAFVGKAMACSETSFPQLTSLKLAMLQSLERWEVKSRAMPNLTVLTIEQCEELQMLPFELTEIRTLKKVKIGSMPQKFQEKIRQMPLSYLVEITPYDF
ncbi:disease resistance protein RPH8A-like [Primulina tabacum]|uniref:disease resistance protein RPH8A-like n=1 Tax=Primulina tabacum TaxID=48773 RepID=UPI003F59BA29